MTNPPLVSLLVPIYNVEEYLGQCLESARTQTLEDIEVICINDGSTDSSRAIICSFVKNDARFKLIDKQNSGYGASMNRGLTEAKGEYVGILESDDFIDPTALEMLYWAAREQKAEVVKSNFFYYWSKPKERNEPSTLISLDMVGVADPGEQTGIFYQKPTIWSALYQREFLVRNRIGFLETPGASYQDASFNFKVWACASRVVFLEEAYLHYRQDNEASSVNSPGKVYCVCDEYAEMQRFLDEDPDKKTRLQGLLIRMKFSSYMWNYERLAEDLRMGFLLRASDELRADLESGRLDLSLFDYWTEAELRALLKSPEAFNQNRPLYAKPGKLNSLRYYHSMGGWPLVFKLVKDRLQGGTK